MLDSAFYSHWHGEGERASGASNISGRQHRVKDYV